MNATEVKFRPIPFSVHVFSALRTLIDVITSIFFKLYYGSQGNRIPPIKDDILKQPAIEVARRIRAKQVCLHVILFLKVLLKSHFNYTAIISTTELIT